MTSAAGSASAYDEPVGMRGSASTRAMTSARVCPVWTVPVGYTDSHVPTWASNTNGSGGNRLVVQNDGNLVIYSATRAVWAPNTAGRT
jgi:hypothetical protein